MRTVIRLLALIALAAFFGACSPAAPPTPTTAPESPPDSQAPQPGSDGYPAPADSAYPAPADSPYPAPADSPYPSPEGSTGGDSLVDTGPLNVPEPASDQVGNVRGVLMRINEDGTQTPITDAILYLGDVLTSDGGVEAMVGVDKTTAPTAVTNSRGEFAFIDVEPGRYGLMLDTIRAVVLLNDPADEGNLLVEVVGGEIGDIGELAYPLPEF